MNAPTARGRDRGETGQFPALDETYVLTDDEPTSEDPEDEQA